MIKMYFFKIILASLAIGSISQNIPDENGWVELQRPESVSEEYLDSESEAWVVLSKKLNGEKFLVRFPEDPSCEEGEAGLQLQASQEENKFSLRVEEREEGPIQSLFAERIYEIQTNPTALLLKVEESEEGQALDLFYRKGEKWAWERIFFTSKLIYTFQTESLEMSPNPHRQFVSSLDVF